MMFIIVLPIAMAPADRPLLTLVGIELRHHL